MPAATFKLFDHLLPRPDDYRERVRAAQSVEDLVSLSRCELDSTDLETLDRRMRKFVDAAGVPDGLTPLKLGIISNATVDLLAPCIRATGYRHGLFVETVVGEFGQDLQQALDPTSPINEGRCDAVFLAIDQRGLPIHLESGSPHQNEVDAAIRHLQAIEAALQANHPTAVIFQTLTQPPGASFGSFERLLNGSERAFVIDFNAALGSMLRSSSGDLLLDVENIANQVGLSRWHDQAWWNLGKFAYSSYAAPVLAEHACRLLAAMRGKSKKCLVLDLDNTVWGGVIGDDGLEGIVLGSGSPAGEAFQDVQRLALELRKRGIVLAVCSKNEEDNAREPFQKHPEMLLREEHIAVFVANWKDKASNLKHIAQTLNLGVESLVLLDDNPAERAQVRAELPEVGVPELPTDPSAYAPILLNAGYFEAIAFSEDDSKRAADYQANAMRDQVRAQAKDLDEYLRSLEMRIAFAPFDSLGRKRITQLINKTNQFNLTTRRYTEAEVESMEHSERHWALNIRLEDRFGDNGLIGVVICESTAADTWNIDTWLMSCRVLGRKVEEATINAVVQGAKEHGIRTIEACYIPTKKNRLVESHYAKLGFEFAGQDGDETRWTLNVESFAPFETMMSEAVVSF